MKAQPAGPFPPLHATFVKSQKFLLHVNPELEKSDGRDSHLRHAQGATLPAEKRTEHKVFTFTFVVISNF